MAFVKQPPVTDTSLTTHKLVVIGSGGVGKSSLTIQFFQKQFVDYYDPTIEEQYIQHCEVDSVWCKLDVLDTAGQDEFAAMLDHHMRTGRGFLLVFSVTDRKSYDGVHKLYTKILRLKDRDSYPVLLVGNKVDLVRQRVITTEQGQQLAAELNIPYIETSAREYLNVDEAFHQLVRFCRTFNYDEGGSDTVAPLNGASGGGSGHRSRKLFKRCTIS